MANFIISINWTLVITTILSLVGTGGIVKLLDLYFKNKRQLKDTEFATIKDYKDSLKLRVIELEDKIDHLQARIEELISTFSSKILDLSTENIKYKTLVEQYERELAEKDVEIRLLQNKN